MHKPTPGKDESPTSWKKPETIIDSYIEGDKVTHNGFEWTAVGNGAIYHEPGVTDPIMGDRWIKTESAGSDTEG